MQFYFIALSNVQLQFSSNPINEGQDVTLTCVATANPPISKWTFYKDGVIIQSESSVSTLTLSKVQTGGTFKCQATSNSGRTMESTLTDLTVEGNVRIDLLILIHLWFFDTLDRQHHYYIRGIGGIRTLLFHLLHCIVCAYVM